MNSGTNLKNKILITLLLVVVGGMFVYGSRVPSESNFSSPFVSVKTNQKLSVVIVGDIMLDRNVSRRIDKLGFENFFGGVKDLISKADIAVGNLEGPFTTFKSITLNYFSKELIFTFDPKHAPKLEELGFDILGLANNHTYNFGREGLNMTHDYIRNAGMFYYGDPFNKEELSVITAKNGISIGFVGFHEFYYTNFDKIFSEIETLRPQVDILVVNPHWGIEYKKEPTKKMQEWAYKFIDLGADAVIGTHPHIIADIEEYKGKKIYYSLGNFAFDQYFSEETMTGLVVKMDIEKDDKGISSIKYRDISIKVDNNGVNMAQ